MNKPFLLENNPDKSQVCLNILLKWLNVHLFAGIITRTISSDLIRISLNRK